VTDRDGLLVRAAALAFLGEQVARAVSDVRAELMTALKPGERAIAALGDGTEVGAVTIGRPSQSASVVDESLFLRWVEHDHPDEIVAMVRSSFKTAVLNECKANGYNVTDHGEFVPGVRVGHGSPSYRPSYNKDQLPRFIDAIRANGDLALDWKAVES
jgi:hypothetical protein